MGRAEAACRLEEAHKLLYEIADMLVGVRGVVGPHRDRQR
jgi:hypothetical protein